MKLCPAKAEKWVTCFENQNLSEVVKRLKRDGHLQILFRLPSPETGKKVGHEIDR